jgi:predicted RNA methylase
VVLRPKKLEIQKTNCKNVRICLVDFKNTNLNIIHVKLRTSNLTTPPPFCLRGETSKKSMQFYFQNGFSVEIVCITAADIRNNALKNKRLGK